MEDGPTLKGKMGDSTPLQLPAIQLPHAPRSFTSYEDLCFYLGQSTRLGTALRETYGYDYVGGQKRLHEFLDEEPLTLAWMPEQMEDRLFTGWGLVSFRSELQTCCYKHLGLHNLQGCQGRARLRGKALLASLMPKYCEAYRKLHGETHQIWKEEDEINSSFFADIDSLKFLPTATVNCFHAHLHVPISSTLSSSRSSL